MNDLWDHIGKRQSLRKLSEESVSLRLKKTPGSKAADREGPSATNSKESSNLKPKVDPLECIEDEELGETSRNMSRQSDNEKDNLASKVLESKDLAASIEISEFSLRSFLIVREFASFLSQVNLTRGEHSVDAASR